MALLRHKLLKGRLRRFVLPIVGGLAFGVLTLDGNISRDQGYLDAGKMCGYSALPYGFRPISCAEVARHKAAITQTQIGVPLFHYQQPKTNGNIGKVILVSGEKSVIAGQGEFMSAAKVEDRLGNTVADGTHVDFIFDGILAARAITRGGIAQTVFRAPLQAGTVEIASKVDDIVAMGNVVRVVPAEPVSLKVSRARGSGPVNDGEEIWFETTPMKDQFGNRLDDGALVLFAGEDKSGRRILLHGVVVNGIATANIINRHIDQKIDLIGHHKDIVGPVVSAEFAPVVFPDRLQAYLSARRGMVHLEIGPLADRLNKYVKDGMPFELYLADGRVLEEATDGGYLNYMFTNPEPDHHMRVVLRAGTQRWFLDIGQNRDGVVHFVTEIPTGKDNG